MRSREQSAPVGPVTRGRLASGTKLGKHEILRFIAEGGMGELYVARASGIQGFEKTVALKRILSRFAAREEHVRMFLDEARLAATLHHPNIVQVFDIGDEDGSLFFTMEYVHGTDLRAVLDRARETARPIPLPVAFEITLGIAAGLHHAHQAGIVHRDVSPSNVLLAHDGVVKVTDFGIAKVSEKPIETRPGMMKGKVSYMSPEQCRDEPLDRRSDVFAIGILLYELTTLDKPFPGTSDFAIMEHIVHRDPDRPSTRRAGYPPELEAIAMRALRRELAQRYATAQDVQRDLLALARELKLERSSLVVESYLRELFAGQVDAWRAAFVQSSLQVAPTAATVREADAQWPTARSGGAPTRRRRWPIAAIALAAAAGGFALTQTSSSNESAQPSAAPVRIPQIVPAPSPALRPPATVDTTAAPTPAVEVARESNPSTPRAQHSPTPAQRTETVPPRRPRGTRTPRSSGVKREALEAAPAASSTPPTTSSAWNPAPAAATPKPPPPSTPPDASTRAREVPWDPDSPTFPQSR